MSDWLARLDRASGGNRSPFRGLDNRPASEDPNSIGARLTRYPLIVVGAAGVLLVLAASAPMDGMTPSPPAPARPEIAKPEYARLPATLRECFQPVDGGQDVWTVKPACQMQVSHSDSAED